jgi:CHASE2 domain-containing sensor protein
MDPLLRQLLYRIRRDWRTVAPFIKRTLFATLFGCLPVLLISTGITEVVEPLLLRQWFNLRGRRDAPDAVTIVRLDKPAYDLVRLSTGEMYPRDRLADGIEKIADAGARLIVLDAILQRTGDNPEADQALAHALAASPSIIGRHTEEITDIDSKGDRKRRRFPVLPVEPFRSAAKAVIPLEVRLINGVVQGICLSNDRDVLSDIRVPLLAPLREFVSGDIPEPGGFDFINFYGGPSTLTSLSLAEVIGDGRPIDSNYFKDRVVFIGVASAAGAGIEAGKDTFLTSVSRSPMHGVEIHATIAANLIDQSWIRRLPAQIESLTLGLLALAISFIILSAGAVAAPLLAVTGGVVWLGLSYYAFSELYTFVPALTLTACVFPPAVAFRWGAIVLSHPGTS